MQEAWEKSEVYEREIGERDRETERKGDIWDGRKKMKFTETDRDRNRDDMKGYEQI